MNHHPYPLPTAIADGAAASVPPTRNTLNQGPAFKKRLPHLRVPEATYFVTWRLHPSQASLSPEERGALVPPLVHFAGTRYALHAFVVMDDHIHILLTPATEWPLENIVHSLKSFTANLLQKAHRRSGVIWQKDYFDRIIRDSVDYWTVWAYVVGNPFKRWPDLERYPWVGVCPVGGTEAAAPSDVGTVKTQDGKGLLMGWDRNSLL